MLILFVTATPLAGAPFRIAQALNKYTNFNVRLINLNPNCYNTRVFPEDLIWEKDKNECLELISQADIIQFFHFFDFETENNPFGYNFLKNSKPRTKFIRMFSSCLKTTALSSKHAELEIINDKYPKLVIPHYPERTFLNAFIVPNIIPINDEILTPKPFSEIQNKKPVVFYSASLPNSMWTSRWDTKGLPEVCEKFKKLKRRFDFDFRVIQNIPYIQCQKIKQQSDIVIGDIVTGSYHLTDLEALSQGKPVFSYLDSRTQFTLQNLLKCEDLPFINTRLEEIDLPFEELIKNEKLRVEIGSFSRFWIEKYYNEQKLVKFYEEAYQKVLNDEPLIRQNYLDFKTAKRFLYNDLYDLQYKTRQQKNQTLQSKISIWLSKIYSNIKLFFNTFFRKFKNRIKKYLKK